MSDDWRERWRSWLHPDSYAHPDSPAGGSGTGFSRTPGATGYSWSPLPDPNSPAGRFIHFQTEIWALEQRERDELGRHVEQLETSLADRSDAFRASIPDGYLRTLYDRQVGRTKGTYDFAKSLIATGVDTALLLQKLTSPVGWLDPDLQQKLQKGVSFGAAVSKVYVKWEFGTLQEKKQILQQVGTLAERVYAEAQNSIQRQWAEAKRTGKQEELIERWKTRLLLEIGTLAIGAGELKGASSAAKELGAADLIEDARLPKPPKEPPRGLAYRIDLDEHLPGSDTPGPDSFVQDTPTKIASNRSYGTLFGTHNLDNAKAALDSKNASYSLKPTSTPGIYKLQYEYFDLGEDGYIKGSKTVYDPNVYSDDAMLGMAQNAGEKGFNEYVKNPLPAPKAGQSKSFDIAEGPMKFRVYINFSEISQQTATGMQKVVVPYVGNVHPIE